MATFPFDEGVESKPQAALQQMRGGARPTPSHSPSHLVVLGWGDRPTLRQKRTRKRNPNPAPQDVLAERTLNASAEAIPTQSLDPASQNVIAKAKAPTLRQRRIHMQSVNPGSERPYGRRVVAGCRAKGYEKP